MMRLLSRLPRFSSSAPDHSTEMTRPGISNVRAARARTEAFGEDKATLFFKLHELQTCSWGVSKIGRIAQRIDPSTKYLYSEFDTSIFSLTVIPVLGWFKLLPTFGGCVVTASKCKLEEGGVLKMEVDYTTSRPVPGLSGLGEWIWKVKVPVGFVWKLLPWNKGRAAMCSVAVKYVDDDLANKKNVADKTREGARGVYMTLSRADFAGVIVDRYDHDP